MIGTTSKILCEKVTNRNQARQPEEFSMGFKCKRMCVRWRKKRAKLEAACCLLEPCIYEREDQKSTVINRQQRRICGNTLGRRGGNNNKKPQTKTNRDLWRTGLARKKNSKPRNFLLLIDTQHIQGFIGIVCNLPESKTY